MLAAQNDTGTLGNFAEGFQTTLNNLGNMFGTLGEQVVKVKQTIAQIENVKRNPTLPEQQTSDYWSAQLGVAPATANLLMLGGIILAGAGVLLLVRK